MERPEKATNISIRHAEPGDYEAVRQVLMGPRAVWGTLQLPYPSAEQWRKRLSERPDGLFNLLATVEDEVVGQLGLHTSPQRPRRRHVGQLGMAVRDDWQGRGVGSALMQAAVDLADRWLNLLRLELDVYTDNAAAIALYTKFGFVVEGTHRRYAFRDGAYVDSHTMARLRPE
jgi:L-phenylalanine/L-methionine N-acetyltransferase